MRLVLSKRIYQGISHLAQICTLETLKDFDFLYVGRQQQTLPVWLAKLSDGLPMVPATSPASSLIFQKQG